MGVSWLLVYLLGLESFAFVFDTAHVNVMVKFIGRVTTQASNEFD
jgi:hypothetical protein